jgi:hypothetical protein
MAVASNRDLHDVLGRHPDESFLGRSARVLIFVFFWFQLLSGYKKDPSVTEILNDFDFYIVPVLNVDGYEYSVYKDRMWRKTRSTGSPAYCFGADPNRNFDSNWGGSRAIQLKTRFFQSFQDFVQGEGASSNQCSDSYFGKYPFSEIEVKQLADFLLSNKNIVSYISFHSFAQYLMFPYGILQISMPYSSSMDVFYS